MQFTSECWIRAYRLESDWLGAFGWQVRATFYALAVKLDAAGDIPLGSQDEDATMAMLTTLTGIPVDVLAPSIETLVQAGVLVYRDTEDGIALHDPRFLLRQAGGRPNTIGAKPATVQKANEHPQRQRQTSAAMTGAERTRACRERKRQQASSTSPTTVTTVTDVTFPVTNVTLQPVTRNVTCNADCNGLCNEKCTVFPEENASCNACNGEERHKERKKERKRTNPPCPPTGAPGTIEASPVEATPADVADAQHMHAVADRPGETATLPEANNVTGLVVAREGGKDGGASPGWGNASSQGYGAPETALPAQQSLCRNERPKAVRRFEGSFVAAAYQEAIVAVTGGRYVVPREQMAVLDDALDEHGPRGGLQGRVEWLRGAAEAFATQVRADEDNATRFRHGYDPRGFLKWANDGGVRKVIAEAKAKKARAEAARTPRFDPLTEELEAAQTMFEHVSRGSDNPFFVGITIEAARERLARAEAAYAERHGSGVQRVALSSSPEVTAEASHG